MSDGDPMSTEMTGIELRRLAMAPLSVFADREPELAISWTDDWPGTLTLMNGRALIDAAHPWGYPTTVADEDDRVEVLKLLTTIGAAKSRLRELLKKYDRDR